MRNTDIEFPLTLGRDFCGEVIAKGINSDYKIGDRVWGVIPVQKQGCHTEFVTAHSDHISHAPSLLSDTEAASILYAGLTAWSGLFISGLSSFSCSKLLPQKRILILGASGGVGNLATQICRAENFQVVATAAKDALDLVKSLGADEVLDYKEPETEAKLKAMQPFNVILDCANLGTEYAKTFNGNFGSFVTLNSPLLKNFDSDGFVSGGLKSLSSLMEANSRATSPLPTGRGTVKWGFFIPCSAGIQYLKGLVQSKQLKPVVHREIAFENASEGYKLVQEGHLRGKIVLKDFH